MKEEGHGLPVDVPGECGQGCVDVSMGVDPHDRQLPDRCCVAVDGADGQTVQQVVNERKALKTAPFTV